MTSLAKNFRMSASLLSELPISASLHLLAIPFPGLCGPILGALSLFATLYIYTAFRGSQNT